MNEEIMVSVSCLVYNHATYLRQCLDGFVMQKTNFKFEVLVHDDASTDGSQDIIREYEEKYPDIIKPIYQTENQYSKNVAIFKTYQYPRAKGKYFAICEGDDYWCDENKLQKQFDALENNPNCYICVHNVLNINEDGSSMNSKNPKYSIKQGILTSHEVMPLLIDYPFQTTSYFFIKEKSPYNMTELPDFVKESPVGDEIIMLYFASIGDFYYLDEDMSCYRNNSISSYMRNIKESKEKQIIVYKKLYKTMELFDEYSNNKFHNDIEIRKNKYLYKIYTLEGNYKELVKSQFRPFFKKERKKERIWFILNAYFPHLVKLIKR